MLPEVGASTRVDSVSDATRSLRVVAKLSLSNVRPQPVPVPFDTCVLPHFPTAGIPREAPASRPRPPEYARIDDGGRPPIVLGSIGVTRSMSVTSLLS